MDRECLGRGGAGAETLCESECVGDSRNAQRQLGGREGLVALAVGMCKDFSAGLDK